MTNIYTEEAARLVVEVNQYLSGVADRVNELEAENERLKAEIKTLRQASEKAA